MRASGREFSQHGWHLQSHVCHRTQAGAGRELGILRQNATRVAWLRLPPFGEAGFQFSGGNAERDRTFFRVDGDGVTVFDDGNRAADEGLWGDVADDETVTAAAEAAIGDECDVFAEAFAHDGAGG